MLDTSPELVLEILDMLAVPLAFQTDELPPTDRAALCSCSLVCKSWSTHSQRLLFQRVSIDTLWTGIFPMRGQPRRPINRITSFLETITADTEKSHWLRENVLSIILRPHLSKDIIAILTNLRTCGSWISEQRACLAMSSSRSCGTRCPVSGLCVSTQITRAHYFDGALAMASVIKLVTVLPTIRMLDVTGNNF
ncbi:hypothetical protein B0H13DRAFT_2655043 [Mycena leptocephala]|nr:hypothetical protein B0H13DRAFT_2655043 [Mycena leptocephala]